MSWWAVGTAAAGVVVSYVGQQQAASDAANARRQAEASGNAQLALGYEQLDFQKEQYADWEETYGPAQERMAQFYSNLTPDQVAATGLQKQAETFAQVRAGTKRTAAQKGVTSPALDMMEQQIDIEEAKGKAQIRADAPGKVAEMQGNFVSMGKGNPMANNVSNAMNTVSNAYGNQQTMALQQQQQAQKTGAAAWGAIGQGLQTGASTYARYKTNRVNQDQTITGPGYQ